MTKGAFEMNNEKETRRKIERRGDRKVERERKRIHFKKEREKKMKDSEIETERDFSEVEREITKKEREEDIDRYGEREKEILDER